MNTTTLSMCSLGALTSYFTFVRPKFALFLIIFSLIAFDKYLGGYPNPMTMGGTRWYGADFFVILLAAGLIRAILRKDLDSRVDKGILVVMLVYTIVGVVASLIGFYNGHEFNVVIGDFRRYSYYPWAIFIPPLILESRRNVHGLEIAIFAASAIICVFASYRIITLSSYMQERVVSGYGSFRAMGYHDYIILIFVVCISIGKVLSTKNKHLLPKVCIVVLPIFVFASNYRMAWALLGLSCFLVLFILRAKHMSLKPIMRIAMIFILAVTVIGTFSAVTENEAYLEIETRFKNRVIQFNWGQQEGYRHEMWRKIIEEWKTAPVMGLGFGKRFYYQAQSEEGKWYWRLASAPHNSYLELLLKCGLLGVGIFLIVHLIIFVRLKRVFQICPNETPFIAAGIAFMIAVLVQTAMQPLLTASNQIVLFYLIMGTVISLPSLHPDPELPDR